MYQVYNCQFPNISQGSQRIAQNSNSSLTENKMKFTLVLASLVFVVLASAHEAEDSKNSELAESANNVESADLELLRLGREAGKKDKRKGSQRGKKGGKGKKKNLKKKSKKAKKTKKGKKSKKNRRNKKKQRNNEKLFCCCNKDTGEKICKKDDSKICLAGFIVCDKPPSPAPTPVVTCPPTPTCPPPPGCEADLAQKMKDLKKVSNWIKQYKRLNVFLKRVSNKKGKSDNFVNASMALATATMNGTMCGLGGPDPEANDAWNTLKVCRYKKYPLKNFIKIYF